jgi:hypothetical protein
MPLNPLDRKIALMRVGVTMTEIGRRAGNLTVGHVSEVLYDRRRSLRVEEEIAKAIKRPIEEVFPPMPEKLAKAS